MTKTESITDKQKTKILTLMNHAAMNYEYDQENQAAIYKLFAKRFGIIIIASSKSGEDEFSTISSKDGAKLFGPALDVILNQIIKDIQNSTRTLEHAPTSQDGKFKTFTTTQITSPNASLIQKVFNEAKEEVPMQIKVEAIRRGMQEAQSEISALNEQELVARMLYFEAAYKVYSQAVAESYQKRQAKAYEKIKELHNASALRTNKSQPKTPKIVKAPKMSEEDKAVWKVLPNGATQEQFESKKLQMQELGFLDKFKPAPQPSKNADGKFNIQTTNSTEESYG